MKFTFTYYTSNKNKKREDIAIITINNNIVKFKILNKKFNKDKILKIIDNYTNNLVKNKIISNKIVDKLKYISNYMSTEYSGFYYEEKS